MLGPSMPSFCPQTTKSTATAQRLPRACAMYYSTKQLLITFGVVVALALADGINFKQQLSPPSPAQVIVSKVAKPDEWFQMWMFAVVETVEEHPQKLAYLQNFARPPNANTGEVRQFPTWAILGESVCDRPKPGGAVYNGPADWLYNVAPGSVSFFSTHDKGRFNFTIGAGGRMRMEDDGHLSLRVHPFGKQFTFEWDDPQDFHARYLQILGEVSGTIDGKAVRGFGGVERYVGKVDWGHGTAFENWYTDWLLFADLAEKPPRYGFSIVSKGEFQGGYSGTAGGRVNLIDSPAVTNIGYDDHCNAIIQKVTIDPIGSFNATAQIIVVPAQGFSWLAILPQAHTSVFGWWEHLNRG